MTANLNALSNVNPYNGDEKIIVGNGESLKVKHIGFATLVTPHNALILNNILHVP